MWLLRKQCLENYWWSIVSDEVIEDSKSVIFEGDKNDRLESHTYLMNIKYIQNTQNICSQMPAPLLWNFEMLQEPTLQESAASWIGTNHAAGHAQQLRFPEVSYSVSLSLPDSVLNSFRSVGHKVKSSERREHSRRWLRQASKVFS